MVILIIMITIKMNIIIITIMIAIMIIIIVIMVTTITTTSNNNNNNIFNNQHINLYTWFISQAKAFRIQVEYILPSSSAPYLFIEYYLKYEN